MLLSLHHVLHAIIHAPVVALKTVLTIIFTGSGGS